jgi:hypothetical protein
MELAAKSLGNRKGVTVMGLESKDLDKLIEKQIREKEREKFLEWRRKLDEEKHAREMEEQKKQYWMRCPKCGHSMEETDLKMIRADRCTNRHCQGIYLDKGELEILMDLHLDEQTSSQLLFSLLGMKKKVSPKS